MAGCRFGLRLGPCVQYGSQGTRPAQQMACFQLICLPLGDCAQIIIESEAIAFGSMLGESNGAVQPINVFGQIAGRDAFSDGGGDQAGGIDHAAQRLAASIQGQQAQAKCLGLLGSIITAPKVP